MLDDSALFTAGVVLQVESSCGYSHGIILCSEAAISVSIVGPSVTVHSLPSPVSGHEFPIRLAYEHTRQATNGHWSEEQGLAELGEWSVV